MDSANMGTSDLSNDGEHFLLLSDLRPLDIGKLERFKIAVAKLGQRGETVRISWS